MQRYLVWDSAAFLFSQFDIGQAATNQARVPRHGSATSGLTPDQRRHHRYLISAIRPQSVALPYAR